MLIRRGILPVKETLCIDIGACSWDTSRSFLRVFQSSGVLRYTHIRGDGQRMKRPQVGFGSALGSSASNQELVVSEVDDLQHRRDAGQWRGS